MLFLPWSRPDPWLGLALFLLALYIAVGFFMTWSLPHYSAPFAPLVYYLVGRGLHVAVNVGRWRHFARALPWVLLISSLGALVQAVVDPQDLWPSPSPGWHLRRARILDELQTRRGKPPGDRPLSPRPSATRRASGVGGQRGRYRIGCGCLGPRSDSGPESPTDREFQEPAGVAIGTRSTHAAVAAVPTSPERRPLEREKGVMSTALVPQVAQSP